MRGCIREHANGSLLFVRVVPGASSAQIVGYQGDELKVRVCSPPVDGRANEEVVRVIASALEIRSREIELVAGHSARSKQLLVALATGELRRRVQLLIGTHTATER